MKTDLLMRPVLDAYTTRKIADLLRCEAPFTWELIEDFGMFGFFSRLPTREELREILRRAAPAARPAVA